MTFLRVYIDSVDTTTFYAVGTLTEDKKILLDFLDKHDHEGSSISLEIWKNGEKLTTLYNKSVYEYLRAE